MEIENLNLQRQIDELKEWKDNWLDTVYPIGSIYISINSTNPEDIFGGAWVAWGSGRVPVGVNTSDSNFNTVEKTGGEKTHTLTTNEMPSHNHPDFVANGQGNGEWGYMFQYDNNTAGRNSGASGFTGGSQPHNNLQPYITCYMWKRETPYFLAQWETADGSFSEKLYSTEELKNLIGNNFNTQTSSNSYKNLKNIIISSYGIYIEGDCSNLFNMENSSNIEFDLSNFNVSKITNMNNMFSENLAAEKIELDNWDTGNVVDMSHMFDDCNSIISLNLASFNTNNVNNMSYMFCNCYALETLNLSNFNTSNVTNMDLMFRRCSSLTTLNLSNFNTSKVTSMSNMFYLCYSLETLNLSNFNTSNVTNMGNMFRDCSSLTTLNLSNFNTSKVTNMNYMFDGCELLKTLDISNFDFSKVTNSSNMFRNIPADCQILVKDQTAKNFVLSARSDLTNVQIKS